MTYLDQLVAIDQGIPDARGVLAGPYGPENLISKAYPSLNDLTDRALAHVGLPRIDDFSSKGMPLMEHADPWNWSMAYLALIVGGYFLVQATGLRMKLRVPALLHNLMLSLVSGYLLVMYLENVWPMVREQGLMWAICAENAWTARLEFLYYANYLVKYWELLDTILLVLRGKRPIFLHVYHHPATLLLCFYELKGGAAVCWVPIVLNLSVHVLMYYYYALKEMGGDVWWKRHLTTMQIVQFILDLAACGAAIYVLILGRNPDWPSLGMTTCRGTPSSAVIGFGILSSYLLLFIQFFIQTYRRPAGAKGGKTGGKGKGKSSVPASPGAARKAAHGSPGSSLRSRRT